MIFNTNHNFVKGRVDVEIGNACIYMLVQPLKMVAFSTSIYVGSNFSHILGRVKNVFKIKTQTKLIYFKFEP